MNFDLLIIIALVGGALGFLLRHLVRLIGGKGGCNCGAGCEKCRKCSSVTC